MNIFKNTRRVDESLLHTRPGQMTVGETIKFRAEDYDDAHIVLLGCPQDEGVSRNRGRPGAARGPAEIRRMLYRFPAPRKEPTVNVFDLGDTVTGSALEETHQRQMDIVEKILQDGKKLIILGGGNDISYPDCAALAKTAGSTCVFNFDSHFDMRDDVPRNSGTPYRQLIEEDIIPPPHLYEIGIQPIANAPALEEFARERRVHIYTLDDVRTLGISPLIEKILADEKQDSLFWGIDMDAVRSSDAPGVSASYPTGLTAEEICMVPALAGRDTRTRILEITEMNPSFDIDHRTARLCSMIIILFIKNIQIV